MPVRHRFYDPIIQTPEEIAAVSAPDEVAPIRGVYVESPGVYVLAEDVATALQTMAQDFEGEARDALMAAAESFDGATVHLPDMDVPVAEPTVTPGIPPSTDGAPKGSEQDPGAAEPHPTVARIEMYPNEDGSYWYARAVNASGDILYPSEIVSGINRDLVESVALGRWPGAPMHALTDAMGDSIWDEQTHAFGFNGRRRPSPRRLWT